MRKVITVGLMVAASLAFANASASAKPGHGTDDPGVAVVTISGAGLEDPILWSADPAWRLLYLTTFRAVGAPAVGEPAHRGPALHAAYRVVDGEGHVLTLEQELYPCAEQDAVWSFTPPDQDDVRLPNDASAATGWARSAALFATLREAGVPACSDLDLRGGAVPSGADGSSGPRGLWVGFALVAALVTAGALRSRTDRPSGATLLGR
jgi:hypothetical protein